jgi:hypothetical protein
MAAAFDQAAGHRRFASLCEQLGEQGSNLNVLLNNVLNILTVNLGPEGSPRQALQRAKGPKRRRTLDLALGPMPNICNGRCKRGLSGNNPNICTKLNT